MADSRVRVRVRTSVSAVLSEPHSIYLRNRRLRVPRHLLKMFSRRPRLDHGSLVHSTRLVHFEHSEPSEWALYQRTWRSLGTQIEGLNAGDVVLPRSSSFWVEEIQNLNVCNGNMTGMTRPTKHPIQEFIIIHVVNEAQ